VERRSNESFDALLKRFRKKVARDRVLSEARKHRYFVSNSQKRRIALQKAIRRQSKRQRRKEQRGTA
jgi:ribosomal protein S21